MASHEITGQKAGSPKITLDLVEYLFNPPAISIDELDTNTRIQVVRRLAETCAGVFPKLRQTVLKRWEPGVWKALRKNPGPFTGNTKLVDLWMEEGSIRVFEHATILLETGDLYLLSWTKDHADVKCTLYDDEALLKLDLTPWLIALMNKLSTLALSVKETTRREAAALALQVEPASHMKARLKL